MRWLLNGLYAVLLTVLSPVIVWRIVRHGRYRRGLAEKLLGQLPSQAAIHGDSQGSSRAARAVAEGCSSNDGRPVVWFHAVSVGEIVQLRRVVDVFRRETGERYAIVVSTSTDTGFDLARQRFADCCVTWFPLDFSWSVRRALQRVQPRVVVLMELELWPNFLAECRTCSVPVAVINARMSDRSHRRYLNVRRMLHPMFSGLSLVAAQSVAAAERLRTLGVAGDRLAVTGSVKFDGVLTDRSNPATLALRQAFGIAADELVFIAGSTQDPEESLALDAWLRVRQSHPNLRLILVPRHRERFQDVATLITSRALPVLRRSECRSEQEHHNGRDEVAGGSRTISDSAGALASRLVQPVLLLDTIGELAACWGLADIAFVGGSFGSRGGQNMIEPAAFGACILFGPDTRNFRDVVSAFRGADACCELARPDDLAAAMASLLADPVERRRLGDAARAVVTAQQGATQLTVTTLLSLLPDARDADTARAA